jgi:methylation protein EvaC
MICPICDQKKLNAFLNLGLQPLANKYPKNLKEIDKEQKHKLNLLFCSNCLNVKIDKLIDRKKMFEEYFYLSSINLKLVKHFKKLAKKFKKNDFVLDIGSNDGILLRELKALGIKHLGVDPSVNVAKLANKKGLKTLVGFFDEKITNKIIKDFGKPNIIVASSIFTHLEDPTDFVKNAKKLLSKDGTLIIEVEYLAKFIKNIEFERFYFDRPFYYSIKSIDILFKSYGMSLTKVEEIETHGGSIRCFIKNAEDLKKTQNTKKLLINEKKTIEYKKIKQF